MKRHRHRRRVVVASPCPALSRPAPVCVLGTKQNEHCDLDHRRTVHALQLDVRLLPRYGRDELPSCKPQRVSHVMLGVIIYLHILVLLQAPL